MSQDFKPGDFLIFQLESAYGVLRILDIEKDQESTIWHLAAYNEFFLDVESAEEAINKGILTINIPHVALTNRAFFATQTARMSNQSLTDKELKPLHDWKKDPNHQVHDRSIRLMIGIR
ncbi:MAG: hypothetical protein N2Z23_08175 [Pyrinomonadaceae bacterium]|nr:hypothetical protein [Pyrinomonadaceae bacterium]MCX7640398.1 hypothetical protein [Pyrinomonadaceae bacterium]MDW8304826.1 hypothetical protein [Acidobacteriota bacterium]